jgi:DNA-binding transcriptional regulator YhcF (GntR family)
MPNPGPKPGPRPGVSLVDQVVQSLTQKMASHQYRPGSRVMSIRECARIHGVSVSTVVEAYDRLVALGVLSARRGAGFFVQDAERMASHPHAQDRAEHAPIGSEWLLRNILEHSEDGIAAGCG